MKNLAAILLAALLTLSLAACATAAPGVDEPAPATRQPTEPDAPENTAAPEPAGAPADTPTPQPEEKPDVSGVYTDKQGTPEVYSDLTLALREDGAYGVEIGIYRAGTLRGTAVWEGDRLHFTSETPRDVTADISVADGKAEMTVISDAGGFLDADVYSFPDAGPEDAPQMKADELLDLFINGWINAVDPADLTSTFYITDLNMDPEEWDAYSVGEKIDLDNDGENELILNGPYGGIYLDARDGQVYVFAAGEGDGFTLSYTCFKGAVWILYSNRMHQGYESYHMELFDGADNLVEEMDFNEELIDENNVEGPEKYYLNGTEITYDEYLELSGEIFAAQVNTN